VSGEEELVVQGQVDGKVVVKGQGVTVGKSGKVKANIHARTIRVEGEVRGDLFGEQEVIIEASGDVEGNLIAPSVRLENGSRFKGSIDMESAKKTAPRPMVPPGGPPGATAKPMQPDGGDSSSNTTPPSPGQPPLRP
jgi:cytoskeletal protein CcmA (bactofilin family)